MRRPHREEAQRWLTHASDEFEDADELRKRGRFYLALFHFQQATEKALIAYLYVRLKSLQVFYTHSIAELAQMAIDIDPAFKKVAAAKKLDAYYIPTRYPNGLPGDIPSRYFDDPKEAEDAMVLAKNTLIFIKEKLEKEV